MRTAREILKNMPGSTPSHPQSTVHNEWLLDLLKIKVSADNTFHVKDDTAPAVLLIRSVNSNPVGQQGCHSHMTFFVNGNKQFDGTRVSHITIPLKDVSTDNSDHSNIKVCQADSCVMPNKQKYLCFYVDIQENECKFTLQHTVKDKFYLSKVDEILDLANLFLPKWCEVDPSRSPSRPSPAILPASSTSPTASVGPLPVFLNESVLLQSAPQSSSSRVSAAPPQSPASLPSHISTAPPQSPFSSPSRFSRQYTSRPKDTITDGDLIQNVCPRVKVNLESMRFHSETTAVTTEDQALAMLKDVLAKDQLSKIPAWVAPCPHEEDFNAFRNIIKLACDPHQQILQYDTALFDFVTSSMTHDEMNSVTNSTRCDVLLNMMQRPYFEARQAYLRNAPRLALAKAKQMLFEDPDTLKVPERVQAILQQTKPRLLLGLVKYMNDMRVEAQQQDIHKKALVRHIKRAKTQIDKINRYGIPE